MENAKPIDSSMGKNSKLDADEPGLSVNETMYRVFIGSLLYLIASSLNTVFSVGICASFQANPKESHLKVVKRILTYLKKIWDLILYYPTGDSFILVGYADADYVGDQVDTKSTSGMAHFLGSCLVSWGIKKQNSVALSTVEIEYVVVTSCCVLLWIRLQLNDFSMSIHSIPFSCNNTSALSMAKVQFNTKDQAH